MNICMDASLASTYRGPTQRARVMAEGWVSRELYCPRCGAPNICQLANNRPVADFECPACSSQFELKSKSGGWTDRVNDGAYNTLVERITSDTNPDWLFMGYRLDDYTVRQLFVVPKHFFTPQIVERRPPLKPTARRAGWVGCVVGLACPKRASNESDRQGESKPQLGDCPPVVVLIPLGDEGRGLPRGRQHGRARMAIGHPYLRGRHSPEHFLPFGCVCLRGAAPGATSRQPQRQGQDSPAATDAQGPRGNRVPRSGQV